MSDYRMLRVEKERAFAPLQALQHRVVLRSIVTRNHELFYYKLKDYE